MKLAIVFCLVLGVVFAEESAHEILGRAIQSINPDRVKRYAGMGDSMRLAFNLTDANGDGHVTEDEMIAMIKRTGKRVTPLMRTGFNIMFSSSTYDWNGNGTLELDEYTSIARMGLRMNGNLNGF